MTKMITGGPLVDPDVEILVATPEWVAMSAVESDWVVYPDSEDWQERAITVRAFGPSHALNMAPDIFGVDVDEVGANSLDEWKRRGYAEPARHTGRHP